MSQRHFKLSTESHVITCTKYNGILWQSYNNKDIYNDIQKHQCTSNFQHVCFRVSQFHTIFLSQSSSHQQDPLLKTVSALHGSFCSELFPPTHRPALSAPCCTAHLLSLRHQKFLSAELQFFRQPSIITKAPLIFHLKYNFMAF